MSDPYSELASEVIAQPQTLRQLTDWFDSDNCRSGYPFGKALGNLDLTGSLGSAISEWIEQGKCQALVEGYLNGTLAHTSVLAECWSDQLDNAASMHPEYSAKLTFQADVGERGGQRILSLITNRSIPPWYLRGFSVEPWTSALGESEKVQVLHTVLSFEEDDRATLIGTGLSLIAGWTDYARSSLPESLASPSLQLLKSSLQVRFDAGNWGVLLKLIAKSHPAVAAETAILAITSVVPSRLAAEDKALETLIELASTEPGLVMDSIGRRLTDRTAQAFFSLCRVPGLFEAIGVGTLRQWVKDNGASEVKYIARHIESPYLNEGRHVVPPVTEWILADFENDEDVFREFCLGRHSREIRTGHARDQRTALQNQLEPFATHPLRRIRDWVNFELKSNERDAQLDDYLDDMQERL